MDSNSFNYAGKELEAMSFANNYYTSLIQSLAPYLGKRVAEVGAGIGNLSTLILKNQINELTAIEPSANLYPILSKRLNKHSNVTKVNNYFHEITNNYENYFDSIETYPI